MNIKDSYEKERDRDRKKRIEKALFGKTEAELL